ncbi:D-alanyl-D-alanine carboxypeptidase [Streptomyces sp. NPDC053750]|uniref:D-alanyl-D-alanine carboxypeptidase n=1 Tax=Streptomyces sp. NPDC053750 TaxID=3365714 RepID=UPI0037D930E1
MEEASVAGESPDRSKQRESSEEPTSGSAGPVPEARTETNETRDPRLAVARETAKPSKSAGSRGGVDTATRVLSVRDTAADAGAEAEAAKEAGTEAGAEAPDTADTADTSHSPESDRAEPAAANDGRLRDAVAAWVATAEERAAANARHDDAEAPEAAETAAEDTEDAGTTEEAPKAPEGAEESADGPEEAEGAEESADGPEKAEGAEEAGDGPEKAEDGHEGASEAVGDGEELTGGPEEAEGVPVEADADAGTDPATDEAADTPSEPEPQPEAETETDAESDADAKSETGTEDDTDTDAEVAPDGGGKADAAADPDTDTDPDAGTDSKADADADADAGKSPVDQPTAVFKAPRPSAPAVDQPTTMLKLGDAATPKKAEEKGRSPEADAERTSKFVALRHPDDPATRKPPRTPSQAPSPAPEAPQAPRTGTTTAVPHVGPERTTQQPVPPKPPLDLLAELTNTPPPPETPLRTTVRRVKIWTPLVILLVIVFGVVQAMRPLPAPTLELTAQDSFTFEGGKPEIPWPSSGQAALDVQGIGTFGSSGDQKPVPIASVAKVMTAYVVLRDHPLKSGAEGPKIPIDQAAEDQSQAGQESTVNVYAGDSISQREALESILIASANNVARLLARWDAGSEKAFVEKMNAAAKDLGMTNTTYTDPSGLNDTTVSTAVDQVKLAKAAMQEPAFREVAAMMSYDDYKGVNHSNWNHLVGSNGVVGIKTGTTTSALGNLVFAAKKEVGGETRTIVGAVVRQPAGGKDNTILGAALDSSDKLIRAAQDILESSTILQKGTVVGYVDDGLGNRTPVVATQDVKAVGWPGLTVKLTFQADEVPHTAAAGTKVGTLTVGDGGAAGAVKVPVALQEELAEPAFTDKLTRLG